MGKIKSNRCRVRKESNASCHGKGSFIHTPRLLFVASVQKLNHGHLQRFNDQICSRKYYHKQILFTDANCSSRLAARSPSLILVGRCICHFMASLRKLFQPATPNFLFLLSLKVKRINNRCTSNGSHWRIHKGKGFWQGTSTRRVPVTRTVSQKSGAREHLEILKMSASHKWVAAPRLPSSDRLVLHII